jgi:pimeloyl-ACP methyl ester carboxylesterase
MAAMLDEGADLEPNRKAVIHFVGAGVRLAADVAGPPEGAPVVFLHGGGQTRASWKGAVNALATRGRRVVSLDLRGHGDSDWDEDGDYSLDRFVDDLACVLPHLSAPPVLVGASMGGLTALMAVGDRRLAAAGLVLVDVTPKLEVEGTSKIRTFMTANPEGFASIEEAADAVAAYLPHRPRPKDVSGLAKNLRQRDDGRFYWHWDPRFMSGERLPSAGYAGDRLEAAARALDLPTLLIRGGRSEIVSEAGARAFLELAPHAEFVDVTDADHMVAGDANDAFNAAVIDFIDRRV